MNLKYFEKQQLSKEEMNQVVGGKKYKCIITHPDGSTEKIKIKAENTMTAISALWAATPEGGSAVC